MRYACVTCIREYGISDLSHVWWPSDTRWACCATINYNL